MSLSVDCGHTLFILRSNPGPEAHAIVDPGTVVVHLQDAHPAYLLLALSAFRALAREKLLEFSFQTTSQFKRLARLPRPRSPFHGWAEEQQVSKTKPRAERAPSHDLTDEMRLGPDNDDICLA